MTTSSTECKFDERTLRELDRFTAAKLDELWMGKPAQKQVLSNALHDRSVSRAKRQLIVERMSGRPLRDLSLVVADVLEETC